jgi:hypothetical protein
MLKVTPHRCHPEKRAVGERAVEKQARKYTLIACHFRHEVTLHFATLLYPHR